MGRPKKYPDELVQRGVRLALEGQPADRSHRPRPRDASRDAAQESAPGRGRQRQAQRPADYAGARGDPPAAQGEPRAAPGERDPEVGFAVFAKELDTDRPK